MDYFLNCNTVRLDGMNVVLSCVSFSRQKTKEGGEGGKKKRGKGKKYKRKEMVISL